MVSANAGATKQASASAAGTILPIIGNMRSSPEEFFSGIVARAAAESIVDSSTLPRRLAPRLLGHQHVVVRDVAGVEQRLALRGDEIDGVADGMAGRRHRLDNGDDL